MFADSDSSKIHAASSLAQEICRAEAERQRRELILIPSESICFPEAARMLDSSLGNIYAEGQPSLRLSRVSTALAKDEAFFLAWQRRLSDGRFYRGCPQADRIELLAKANIAETFAALPGSPPSERIHVNVQALSGAPANLGVYTALLENGDALLGLDLCHGGHLSHGSPFNVTGKQYRVASYGIDVQARGPARVLDYERIRRQAKEHRPKLIIGGASAYPWDFDWQSLRSIADEVGAYLLADIAHLAGMVAAGVLANPLPHAHVVTFTTHKTLCGPRGAVILSTCPELAKAIDGAVFPGLQGGPHMNAIAAIARLFEILLAKREDFARLQHRIVENAQVLAEALAAEGFTLEYGGTNTHLLLVDLKAFEVKGGHLDGETASRLLENVGIICNSNTLPGDKNAAFATGLRFGTPWLTQRGVTPEQLRALARIIRETLGAAQTFRIWASSGEERCRGRLSFEKIIEWRGRVEQLAAALPYPKPSVPREAARTTIVPAAIGNRAGLLVRGEKARLGLSQACTCPLLTLEKGRAAHGFLLRPDGTPLDDIAVVYLGWEANPACGPNGEERFAIFPHRAQWETVTQWLRALSDGYILLDPGNPFIKVDGPLAVEPLPPYALDHGLRAAIKALPEAPALDEAPRDMLDSSKPFFVGQQALAKRIAGEARPVFAYRAGEGPLRKTGLNEWHRQAGAKMVPFGGWEMPVEYPSGIFREHAAVRSAAGLFDVSHMSVLEVCGPRAVAFLEVVLSNTAARLVPGEAQYSYLLLPDGTALDDLYVYRLGRERFLVVVNAGNTERDVAWLKAVNDGEVRIDPDNPAKRAPGPVQFRPLRDAGKEALIDLAFQGPLSLPILCELAAGDDQRSALRASRQNEIMELELAGIPVRAARTGYTGEPVGFELFVHPERGPELWEKLLETGKERGVLPAGLGARDSLRIEAGFPLFGHELEGPEKLSLSEADYGFVSRFHKPFYIGRERYIRKRTPRKKRLLRLRGQGRRSVRAGHAILDEEGRAAGTVTSFAFCDAEFRFHVLAAVRANFRLEEGAVVKAVRAAPEQAAGETDPRKIVELTVCSRFPTDEEKAAWPEQYRPRD